MYHMSQIMLHCRATVNELGNHEKWRRETKMIKANVISIVVKKNKLAGCVCTCVCVSGYASKQHSYKYTAFIHVVSISFIQMTDKNNLQCIHYTHWVQSYSNQTHTHTRTHTMHTCAHTHTCTNTRFTH